MVRPPRWPGGLDGLTVACVADLHAGAPHMDPARGAAIVRRVTALAPDVVALLGDFVDSHVAFGRRVEPEHVAAALAGLTAPRFAVLGNHDHLFGAARVASALRAVGIPVLVNEVAGLGELRVAGLDDARGGRPDLAMVARGPGPMLVLSHDPDLFPRLAATAALTLSGHTHGGQVNLPFVRARVTPSRFGDRYARGVTEQDGKLLFVTSGVGTSFLPLRLLRPPEIVLLEVRAPTRG